MKTCTMCGESLPLDAFSRRAASVDGLQPKCKRCCRTYNAGWRESARTRGLPAGAAQHGTLTGYTEWGCRCSGCASASAAYQREWRQANADVRGMHKRRRRALLAGVESVPYTADAIIARDREAGGCYICLLPLPDDRRDIHLDHRIPLVRGGADTPDNVFAVHAACNLMKGALSEDEARARILAYV